MSAETARQLYQENYDGRRDYGRGQPVKTGFYIDIRQSYKVPKVYLIINQGTASKSCVIVRPNEGKCTWSIGYARDRLYAGYRLAPCNNVDQALEKWTREFNMADIPFADYYQQSCRGRHIEREYIICKEVR
jgi:hypothetical protein